MPFPIKTFLCYSHKDEALIDRLKIQLKSLQRQGYIDIWYDRDISAGTEWQREIDKQLNMAQLILLLVSPDFLNSDYCYSLEMKRALERHEFGEARVIPIIVRSINFKDAPFSKLQALPKDARPITSWSDIDEAFLSIEEGIQKAVNELMTEAIVQIKISNIYDYKKQKRILVVDDEPPIQHILRRNITISGYDV